LVPAGDSVVVSIVFHGTPRGGNRAVAIEETEVFRMRNGEIVEVDVFRTKAEALQTLRMSE
jgi:hypothetical protein